MIMWPMLVFGFVFLALGVALFWRSPDMADFYWENFGHVYRSGPLGRTMEWMTTSTQFRVIAVGWCAGGLLMIVVALF
ncbi:hypothetical protein OMK64_12505 [Cellulomonas fimi]|uniref:hypothetical protein n=1 Tax=Cellulomonas fimi TaxID=1708 RepID=UPI00234C8901|nr:hypothetical protein [Cellulomonas fimi]MDC7122353.1 hypothetical protein [Cellulomonas fimi]